MNDPELWTSVDQYFAESFIPIDPAIDSALQRAVSRSVEADMHQHHVSPCLGRFLTLLTQIQNAARVLEIGTLAGYSAICFARALPRNGKLISLEYELKHIELARENLEFAKLADLVELRQGRALDLMQELVGEGLEPFDIIFIDADKSNNANYYELALKLSRSGTIIIADNVVRGGEILNDKSNSPSVQGIRYFIEKVGSDHRVSVTALQTVGLKGYDGFALIRVN